MIVSLTDSLLSADEMKRATGSLGSKKIRPARNAKNFQNAVRAFLEDVDPLRAPQPTHRLLCVDATEVVAFARYSRSVWHAFTFGDVLDPKPGEPGESETREKIVNLDRLITHHLFFGRQHGFVLLEPHLEEVRAIKRQLSERIDTLDNTLDLHVAGDLLSLSKAQIDRIARWLLHETQEPIPEFELFRNTFLPALRTRFVEELYGATKQDQAYGYFERNARYRFLTSPSGGERSFLHNLQGVSIDFPWRDFQNYTKRPTVQNTFDEIVRCIEALLIATERDRRSIPEQRQLAANRDARAIGTLHVFNEFVTMVGLPVRAELVSRAPSIHGVVSMLPPDVLDVRVRHPLLLPEAFAFEPVALETLGHLYESVETALAPLNSDLADDAKLERYRQIEPIFRQAANELVQALAGIVAVQQTLEKNETEPVIRRLIERVDLVESINSDSPTASAESTADMILFLFKRIQDALRIQKDPFSIDAINAIADNNFKHIKLESSRLGKELEKSVHLQFLQMRPETSGFPTAFVAFQLTKGRMPRVFHVYSKRAISLIVENEVAASAVGARISRAISISSLLKQASEVLSKPLRDVDDNKEEARIGSLEMTLLACVAFASLGLFETAVTLSSSILNRIMRQLRVIETGMAKFTSSKNFPKNTGPKVPLVLKELFLLRQYCQRAIAREELEKSERTIGHVRYRGIQSFEFAERDLHLAVRMNEHAEEIAVRLKAPPLDRPETEPADGDGYRITPGGMGWFEEFRFTLVSFFGWIDHYIAALAQEAMVSPSLLQQWANTSAQKLWSQHDRWTAAAWAREGQLLAYHIGLRVERFNDLQTKRYFGYAEYTTYQGLLTLFVARLALEPTAEVQVYWNPLLRPTQDKVLAFSAWPNWKTRYDNLASQYEFKTRLNPFFDDVFLALSDIAKLRERGSNDESYDGVLLRMRDALIQRQVRESWSSDVTFAGNLISALLLRCDQLRQGALS